MTRISGFDGRGAAAVVGARHLLHDHPDPVAGVGWTHLARVVRRRVLSLRVEDFVMVAASERDIIFFGHLLPTFSAT